MIYAENILMCFAFPFVISLLFLRGDARKYVAAFLTGMGICLVAAYISGFIGMVTGMTDNDTSIYISPVIEELMKFLLLMFFMLMFSVEDKMLIMLAVAIGAGFATFENSCYILTFGAEDITYVLIRGFAVGVMHIVSILTLSIWFIFIKRLRVFTFSSVVGGVSLAMIFHGLYNLLVSEPGVLRTIGYLLPLFTAVGLYPLYRRIMKEIK